MSEAVMQERHTDENHRLLDHLGLEGRLWYKKNDM